MSEKEQSQVMMAVESDAITFADVERLDDVRESRMEADDLLAIFAVIVQRIFRTLPPEARVEAITQAANEYITRVRRHAEMENRPPQTVTNEEKGSASPDFDEYNLPAEEAQNLDDSGNGFVVWKEKDGGYRWFTAYSNNFLDDDYPAEIISEKSHTTFVEMVDNGVVPYPELWLWHVKGSAVGVSDLVDYSNGFAVATGTFDDQHQHVAENLSKMKGLKVSHGMDGLLLRRDESNPSIITFHITKEISPLPKEAAANKRTMFMVLKGDDGMNDAKKKFLSDVGLDVEGLEQQLAQAKSQAEDEGIPSKEKEAEDVDEVQEVPTTYATLDEVASTLTDVLSPILQANESITARLESLEATVKELKELDVAKVSKMKEETPRASLQELIAGMLSKDAIVADDDPLKQLKPKENESSPMSVTGIPVIDSLIGGAR